jgi:hypothetical protein
MLFNLRQCLKCKSDGSKDRADSDYAIGQALECASGYIMPRIPVCDKAEEFARRTDEAIERTDQKFTEGAGMDLRVGHEEDGGKSRLSHQLSI